MDEMKVGEYSQIIHEPPGYSEEMRATEEEEAVGDQEKEEKRSRKAKNDLRKSGGKTS